MASFLAGVRGEGGGGGFSRLLGTLFTGLGIEDPIT